MRRLAVLTVGAALLLAACSSGDGTASDGSTTTGGDSAETTSADTTTTTSMSSDDCLVGTWLWTSEELQRFWDVIESQSQPATGEHVDFTSDGEITLEIRADGTFTYSVDYSVTIGVAGVGATNSLAGDLSGSYAVEEGTITTENVENTIDITSSVPGVDPSTLGDQLLIEDNPINESPFHCEGENLVLDVATVDGRTPVTFIPV